MPGERCIGIEDEGRAVENSLALSTDLVEIDQRQAALGDAADGDVESLLGVAPPVRGAVRGKQQLGPGLGEALDYVARPDVVTDRNAQPHAADDDRTRQQAGLEHAPFVEYAAVRQINLETHRRDRAFIEQRIGVMEKAPLHPRQPDENGRPAICGLTRERFARLAAGVLERRLEHEALRRIAGQEKLRQHDKVRAEPRGLGARRPNFGGVAGDAADRRVQLGERDPDGIGSHPAGLLC